MEMMEYYEQQSATPIVYKWLGVSISKVQS